MEPFEKRAVDLMLQKAELEAEAAKLAVARAEVELETQMLVREAARQQTTQSVIAAVERLLGKGK